MKLFFLSIRLFILVTVFLIGCTVQAPPAPTATGTPLPPPETSIPSLTPTITKTATPASTPTPAWVRRGPGIVRTTILLYHHVAISPIESQYYIHPENFAQQMQALDEWGFTPIPLSLLVKAITEGAELPPKPVVISFDDGRLDIYENAFPIMQKYDFQGVFYVLSGGLNDETLVGVDALKEMAAAGWEIGSHSHSHADLSKLNENDSYREVVDSRRSLEKALELPITSFAYPFGAVTDTAGAQVHIAGYQSAVGLGYTDHQGPGNLFYLQRRPISWDYDLKRFAIVMGWEGPLRVEETPAP
ncbi:MAG: polysaccharide deacetylase family protein [Anaerolineales bacterium]|uniref:Polysaccharide deacetylase family protein n=1 Tax=Candidatus Desulfolinea nitratireducens TaxID=2841698 RepID=A0A8J6TF26_9CHLR|nr:polysaccharide deacetylase family protein [Candidatus Desulfolinea nitratireducens]